MEGNCQIVHLLTELYAVQRLEIFRLEPDGESLQREFLIRRAAVIDRLSEHPTQPDWVSDQIIYAALYARELVDHDLVHGTGLGPIPPAHWIEDPIGYARQEHREWTHTESTTASQQ
jgi:hypothetical protein